MYLSRLYLYFCLYLCLPALCHQHPIRTNCITCNVYRYAKLNLGKSSALVLIIVREWGGYVPPPPSRLCDKNILLEIRITNLAKSTG